MSFFLRDLDPVLISDFEYLKKGTVNTLEPAIVIGRTILKSSLLVVRYNIIRINPKIIIPYNIAKVNNTLIHLVYNIIHLQVINIPVSVRHFNIMLSHTFSSIRTSGTIPSFKTGEKHE